MSQWNNNNPLNHHPESPRRNLQNEPYKNQFSPTSKRLAALKSQNGGPRLPQSYQRNDEQHDVHSLRRQTGNILCSRAVLSHLRYWRLGKRDARCHLSETQEHAECAEHVSQVIVLSGRREID